MIALILACVVVAQDAQEVRVDPLDGKIVRSYDKFKDQTSFQMQVGKVQDPAPEFEPYIKFVLTSPGHKGEVWEPVKPGDGVGLYFNSSSKHWRFLDSRKTIIMIDGKRFDGGNPKHDGHISSFGGVTESFMVDADVATLDVMSKATKVEMQINGVEFTLKPEHLASMREFVARIKMSETEMVKAKAERFAKKSAMRKALEKAQSTAKSAAGRASKASKQKITTESLPRVSSKWPRISGSTSSQRRMSR